MNLRPHQELAKNMLRESFARGNKRIILGAPCSFGKTITSVSIALDAVAKGRRVMFVCDRVKLIKQSIEAFDKAGIEIGVIQSHNDRYNPRAMVQIASIQTLARRMKIRMPEFEFCIIDECFIGSTLVDGKRIDSLRAGDFVDSYNHQTKKIEKKKVLRVMKKKSKDICAIKTCNGSVYCTPSHKFWDGEKYEEIRNIKGNIYRADYSGNRCEQFVKKMVLSVRNLQHMVYTFFKSNWSIQQWDDIGIMPQSGMQRPQEVNKQQEVIKKNESLFRKWRSRKNVNGQPIEKSKGTQKNIRHTKGNGSQAISARWKWQGSNQATGDAIRLPWEWLGVGVHTENWWCSLSESLQNRFSKRAGNDCNRDRWKFSLFNRKAESRQEKNGAIRDIRVESYQVLEQRDTERLGLLQDENNEYDVWDIEVEDNHNFFANGYLVHNCHTHYKAIQYMMDRYSNVPFIGLSGTPFSKGLGKAYQDLVVPITPEELMAQGYLTPVDYYAGSSIDVKGIKRKSLSTGGTDFDPKALGKAIEDDKVMTGDIIKNWRKHADGMMTIAFSPSIKHSKYLVEMFNDNGISAVHIDGYMEDEDREIIYKAHERGEFLILSCSMLLSVGYDSPKVQAMIDCYPTSSKILWIQRWGRILRLSDGKTKAIYLDHAGNIQRHGMFPEEVVPESLDDGESQYNEKSLLKKEKKKSEPKECPKCSSIMRGLRCVCGYEYPIKETIETTPEILQKIDKYTMDQKMDFYAGMLKIGLDKNYSKGWAYYAYKEKFGVFPNKRPEPASTPCEDAVKFAKYKQIRYSKQKK